MMIVLIQPLDGWNLAEAHVFRMLFTWEDRWYLVGPHVNREHIPEIPSEHSLGVETVIKVEQVLFEVPCLLVKPIDESLLHLAILFLIQMAPMKFAPFTEDHKVIGQVGRLFELNQTIIWSRPWMDITYIYSVSDFWEMHGVIISGEYPFVVEHLKLLYLLSPYLETTCLLFNLYLRPLLNLNLIDIDFVLIVVRVNKLVLVIPRPPSHC